MNIDSGESHFPPQIPKKEQADTVSPQRKARKRSQHPTETSPDTLKKVKKSSQVQFKEIEQQSEVIQDADKGYVIHSSKKNTTIVEISTIKNKLEESLKKKYPERDLEERGLNALSSYIFRNRNKKHITEAYQTLIEQNNPTALLELLHKQKHLSPALKSMVNLLDPGIALNISDSEYALNASDIKNISKKLLHAVGDSFGLESGLEGMNQMDVLRDMQEFFRKQSSLSQEEENVLNIITHAININHYITNEVKKWVPNDTNVVHKVMTILGSALISSPFTPILLFGGWTGTSNHALLYQITRQEDGKFSFTIYNTGAGLEYHPQMVVNSKIKSQTFLTIKDIDRSRLLDPLFLELYLKQSYLRTILPIEEPSAFLPALSAKEIYEGLVPLLGGRVDSTVANPDELMTPQRSGTCTHKVFFAFLHKLLSKPIYKEKKLKYRLDILEKYITYIEDNFGEIVKEVPKLQKLILNLLDLSIENFAESIKKLQPETIGEETYKKAIAIIEKGQQQVEQIRVMIEKMVEEEAIQVPISYVGTLPPWKLETVAVPRIQISIDRSIQLGQDHSIHYDNIEKNFKNWEFTTASLQNDLEKMGANIAAAFQDKNYEVVIFFVNKMVEKLPLIRSGDTEDKIMKEFSGLSSTEIKKCIEILTHIHKQCFDSLFHVHNAEQLRQSSAISLSSLLHLTVPLTHTLPRHDTLNEHPGYNELYGSIAALNPRFSISNPEIAKQYLYIQQNDFGFHRSRSTHTGVLNVFSDQKVISIKFDVQSYENWNLRKVQKWLETITPEEKKKIETRYPHFKTLKPGEQLAILYADPDILPQPFRDLRQQYLLTELVNRGYCANIASTEQLTIVFTVNGDEVTASLSPMLQLGTGTTVGTAFNHSTPIFTNQSLQQILNLQFSVLSNGVIKSASLDQNEIIMDTPEAHKIDLPIEEYRNLLSLSSVPHLQVNETFAYFQNNLHQLSDPNYQIFFNLHLFQEDLLLTELQNNPQQILQMHDWTLFALDQLTKFGGSKNVDSLMRTSSFFFHFASRLLRYTTMLRQDLERALKQNDDPIMQSEMAYDLQIIKEGEKKLILLVKERGWKQLTQWLDSSKFTPNRETKALMHQVRLSIANTFDFQQLDKILLIELIRSRLVSKLVILAPPLWDPQRIWENDDLMMTISSQIKALIKEDVNGIINESIRQTYQDLQIQSQWNDVRWDASQASVFPHYQDISKNYSIDLLSGELYHPSLSIVIPNAIQSHPDYQRLLHSGKLLPKFCTYKGNNTFILEVPDKGTSRQAYFLSFNPQSQELIIATHFNGMEYRLVSPQILQQKIEDKTTPGLTATKSIISLVGSRCIAERELVWQSKIDPSLFISDDTRTGKQYTIEKQSDAMHLSVRYQDGRKFLLADLYTEPKNEMAKFVTCFEDPHYAELWIDPITKQSKVLCLPRFDLEFVLVNEKGIGSVWKEAKGEFFLSPTQSAPSLGIFSCFLALEDKRGNKKILIPNQEIQTQKARSLDFPIYFNENTDLNSPNQTYFQYNIDKNTGELIPKTLAGRFHLAAIHLAKIDYDRAWKLLNTPDAYLRTRPFTTEELHILQRIFEWKSKKGGSRDISGPASAIRLLSYYIGLINHKQNQAWFKESIEVPTFIREVIYYLDQLGNTRRFMLSPAIEHFLLQRALDVPNLAPEGSLIIQNRLGYQGTESTFLTQPKANVTVPSLSEVIQHVENSVINRKNFSWDKILRSGIEGHSCSIKFSTPANLGIHNVTDLINLYTTIRNAQEGEEFSLKNKLEFALRITTSKEVQVVAVLLLKAFLIKDFPSPKEFTMWVKEINNDFNNQFVAQKLNQFLAIPIQGQGSELHDIPPIKKQKIDPKIDSKTSKKPFLLQVPPQFTIGKSKGTNFDITAQFEKPVTIVDFFEPSFPLLSQKEFGKYFQKVQTSSSSISASIKKVMEELDLFTKEVLKATENVPSLVAWCATDFADGIKAFSEKQTDAIKSQETFTLTHNSLIERAAEMQALRERLDTKRQNIASQLPLLEAHILEFIHTIEKPDLLLDSFAGVHKSLTINDAILAYARQDIALLEEVNPQLSKEEIRAIFMLIQNYLMQKRSLFFLDTNITKIDEVGATEKNISEIAIGLSSYPDHYKDPHSEMLPSLLALEEYAGITLRPDQIRMITAAFKSGNSDLHLLVQMLMGTGKTAVLTPILALLRAKPRERLSSIMMPEALLASMSETLNKTAGGAFGQYLVYLPFSRDIKEEKLIEYLQQMYNEIQEAFNKGHCILFTPQIKYSLINALKVSLQQPITTISVDFDKEKYKIELLSKILNFFARNDNLLIDEVHQILTPRLTHNYPIGDKELLREERTFAVFSIVDALAQDKEIRKIASIEVVDAAVARRKESLDVTRPPLTSLLYHEKVKPILVNKVLELLKTTDFGMQTEKIRIFAHKIETTPQDKIALLAYLNENDEGYEFVEKQDPMIRDFLAVYMHTLNHLLPVTLLLECNRNYGAAKERSYLLSRPYKAADEPNITQFGDPYTTLLYTIQMYLYSGIPTHLLQGYCTTICEEITQEMQSNSNLSMEETAGYQRFLKLTSGNRDLHPKYMTEQQLETLAQKISTNSDQMRFFFHTFVFPQILIHPQRVSSQPQNLTSSSCHIIAETATPYNADTYPDAFKRLVDPSVDIEAMYIMWKKTKTNTLNVYLLNPEKEALERTIIQQLSQPHCMVWIDSSGSLRVCNVNTLIQTILPQIHAKREEIKGVVYNYRSSGPILEELSSAFQDGEEVVLELPEQEGGVSQLKRLSESQLKPYERVTIIQEMFTTGTNILQDKNAKAMKTIAKNESLSMMNQSNFRMRDLAREQSIDYWLPPDTEEMIRHKLNLSRDKKITFTDLIAFTSLNQQSTLEQDCFLAIKQKFQNISQQIAWEQILDPAVSCEEKQKIFTLFSSYFIEDTKDRPFETFGRPLSISKKATVLDRMIAKEMQRLEDIFRKNPEIAKRYIQKAGLSSSSEDPVRMACELLKKEFEQCRDVNITSLAAELPECAIDINNEVQIEAEQEKEIEQETALETQLEAEVEGITHKEYQRWEMPSYLWEIGDILQFLETRQLRELSKSDKSVCCKLQDILKEYYGDEVAQSFSETIGFSYNFLPFSLTKQVTANRLPPFHSNRKSVHQLIIVEKMGQQYISIVDQQEAGTLMNELHRHKKEMIPIHIIDMNLNCIRSINQKAYNNLIKNPDFIEKIIQIKFFNGECNYIKEEVKQLEKWLRVNKTLIPFFIKTVLPSYPGRMKTFKNSIIKQLFDKISTS